jgi:glycosyltransferase involved in cell wall biosynthesis
MKVGYFTDTYFPQVNGVTFTLASWKKVLKEKANIYYPNDPSGKYKPGQGEFSFPSIKLPFYSGYRVAFPFGISKLAKELDIVHIHGLFTMAAAGAYIAKKFNLPRIITYHTPVEMYTHYMSKSKIIMSPLRKLYAYWEKRILNHSNLILVPSEPVKEYLKKRGIKNIEVLSNGIETNQFRRTRTTAFRKKYNIKEGKVIGYCGRTGYEKKIEDLIHIAPQFKGQILIAGNGPAFDYYKNLSKNLRNVKFLDFIDRKELPAFYSYLDIFAFPSVVETQVIVALESMACGVPVVGADALALKETIEPGKTGYLYKPGHSRELLEKINLAYKTRKKLSGNCIKFAKENSVENTVKKLLEIYNRF